MVQSVSCFGTSELLQPHKLCGHRGSWFDDTNRTSLSTKSREVILRFQNGKLFALWLHLEILSMKITNRTGDKGKPWRSPTTSGSKFYFVAWIWTWLSLWLYKDCLACSKGSGIPYKRNRIDSGNQLRYPTLRICVDVTCVLLNSVSLCINKTDSLVYSKLISICTLRSDGGCTYSSNL